jgi:hypothetical protein|eukprot:Stramenopile-MAST_4_protein_2072
MAALRDVVAEDISGREEKLAESSGGQNAAISGGLGDRRASQHHTPVRLSVEDMAPFASLVRQYLPPSAGPKNTAALAAPGHEISGFLRLYDYHEGEFSTPHYDRSFTEHDKETGHLRSFSAYSVLIYLNGDFEGGTTTFFQFDEKIPVARSRKGNTPRNLLSKVQNECSSTVRVVPSCGDILVFPHGRMPGCFPDPLHEGSVIKSGRKSIIRTDVVFVPEMKRAAKKRK